MACVPNVTVYAETGSGGCYRPDDDPGNQIEKRL